MENSPQNSSEKAGKSQNVITNNPSDRRPDEQEQNDTGYAGTTNAVSQNHQQSDEYKPAIEDTMTGYDGDATELDTDLEEGNVNADNTRGGIDDND